jgi:hypothetical protein
MQKKRKETTNKQMVLHAFSSLAEITEHVTTETMIDTLSNCVKYGTAYDFKTNPLTFIRLSANCQMTDDSTRRGVELTEDLQFAFQLLLTHREALRLDAMQYIYLVQYNLILVKFDTGNYTSTLQCMSLNIPEFKKALIHEILQQQNVIRVNNTNIHTSTYVNHLVMYALISGLFGCFGIFFNWITNKIN